MQSVLSRIWTRVAVPISYDVNHYTTGTFNIVTGILQRDELIPNVYNLPRLYAMNVLRSNKKNGFPFKKRQEADDTLQKQWQTL